MFAQTIAVIVLMVGSWMSAIPAVFIANHFRHTNCAPTFMLWSFGSFRKVTKVRSSGVAKRFRAHFVFSSSPSFRHKRPIRYRLVAWKIWEPRSSFGVYCFIFSASASWRRKKEAERIMRKIDNVIDIGMTPCEVGGIELCEPHTETCGICHDVFCPSCLCFHQTEHSKPASADHEKDRERKTA